MMTRIFSLLAALTLFATSAFAGAEPYRLDVANSLVGFSYDYGSGTGGGVMPVKSAEILLDPRNLRDSQVNVTLDAHGARTGFLPATRAMKGAEVLHTRQFPEITFRSTGFTGDLKNAQVNGDLTIRGVTRPVTLSAGLFRQKGSEAGDLSRLTIRLTGSVSRAAFGAGGFARQVGDTITLDIVARIER